MIKMIKTFANNVKLLFKHSLFTEISSIKADIHELKESGENNFEFETIQDIMNNIRDANIRIDKIKEEFDELEVDLNNNIETIKTFINFSDNKVVSLSKELDKLKLAFEKLAEKVNSSF